MALLPTLAMYNIVDNMLNAPIWVNILCFAFSISFLFCALVIKILDLEQKIENLEKNK